MPMSSRGVCLSVCLRVCVSVTFVNSVKTNKHIFKIFSPSGSQAILKNTEPHGNIANSTHSTLLTKLQIESWTK